MKNHVKELTEGMQRLCAVANRVVAQQERVSRLELDLLLENLRHLYEVGLQMECALPADNGVACGGEPEAGCDLRPADEGRKDGRSEGTQNLADGGDEADGRLMAMMSTMAAMTSAERAPQSSQGEESSPSLGEQPDGRGSAKERHEEEGKLRIEHEGREKSEAEALPRMEELEQNDNALLFDEVILEAEAPADEPEAGNDVRPADEGQESGRPEGPQELAEGVKEDVGEVQRPVKAEAERPQQASLLDYLTPGAQRTLGESLGADRPQPSSLERKVDDLRTVININDKFSFMSELFHNNMKAYNDFIMRLNATEGREEALAYVREVASQQKWDEGSAVVQAFYKVFDKKF